MELTPEPARGPASPAAVAETPASPEASASPGSILETKSRLPGGGPVGRSPLVRAMRMKQGDIRKHTHAWLDRYAQDQDAAMAELVSLVLVLADVPSKITVEKEDVLNREPQEVMLEVTSALALEATEKGADFTLHWLVSRERGSARARDNYAGFWQSLITSAPYEALLGGLLQNLSSWTLALAECQFRSVRHAATFAGLQLVDGLGLQCCSLRGFITNAQAQIRDAEAQGGRVCEAGGAATRLASLTAELDQGRQFALQLATTRDEMGIALMSRRTKDVDHEVRRSCFEAMNRWARTDPETFLGEVWVRYLQFGLHDRDAKTRAAVLSALCELLKGDPATASPAVQSLAEHVKPRVLERCHDVDPAVGAAAVRCTASLAARQLLAEDEFDPVIDLVWNPDAQRCSEAASFVSRHVFNEDIIDYPAEPTEPVSTAGTGTTTRRRVRTLVQFVCEYTEGYFQLVDRFVGALWRRTTCLEDWEVFAGLALPGGEHALSGNEHTALIHLMDAVARRAVADTTPGASDEKVPSASYAQEVLHRAARALAPQLPRLLVACQAEPVCMRRAASLSHLVLQHCAARRGLGVSSCDALLSGPAGEEAAKALKTAFLRQPDPEALEHIASGLAHLLDLSSAAHPVVRDLANNLRSRFAELAQQLTTPAEPPVEAGQPSTADALLVASTRLRMLAKAYDVSLCDVHNFVIPLLEILDDRANAIIEGKQPAVAPHLVIVLLELASLVFVRHTLASFQPESMVHCVAHDVMNEADLKLLPTAVNDFFNINIVLLKSDPNQHVRTAAMGSTISLLTTWWNTVFYTKMGSAKADVAPIWTLPFNEELTQALSSHLSRLLIDANAVPPGTGGHAQVPEPGNQKQSSAFSQLFTMLARAAAGSAGISEAAAGAALKDADRVRLAALACSLIATCRHEDFVNGPLPALVLSQGLSPREDLQEVAWMLLRRLRRHAYKMASVGDATGAEEFFQMLLRAVSAVHQDAGASVAKDLSASLLQHVGVGKLSATLQAGYIVALQEGIDLAMQDSTRELLLEALIPWITKHNMDDNVLFDLATYAEGRPEELGIGLSTGPEATRAGLLTFVGTCRTTAEKSGVKRNLEEAFEGEAGAEPTHV